MKNLLLFAVLVAFAAGRPVLAADTGNLTNELKTLIAQVRTDVQSGKRTEAELSDDLKRWPNTKGKRPTSSHKPYT